MAAFVRALVIGAAVAALMGLLVWSYLRRFEDEASGGPRIRVLTVLRTIEPGSVLKDSDIGERSIPLAYVESRMIRSGDRERIANLHIASALEAQQVLMWTDIVSTTDERFMSSLVQPGMRAVTIKTDGRASALVHPGDRVDVIATVPQPGSNEHRAGVVLLQNVLVLGRGNNNASGLGSTDNEIALSLSLQSSQLLAVAGDKAKLSLALRAPDDVRVQEGLVDISSSAIAEAEKKAMAAKVKAGPVPVTGAR